MLRNEPQLFNNSRVKGIFSCSLACVQLAAPSPQKKMRREGEAVHIRQNVAFIKRIILVKQNAREEKETFYPSILALLFHLCTVYLAFYGMLCRGQ